MIIRKFEESDRESLISLWSEVFPDDPAHNLPSSVIAAKLAVDDLIFVAQQDNGLDNKLIGACMAGYDGHRGWLRRPSWVALCGSGAAATTPQRHRRSPSETCHAVS